MGAPPSSLQLFVVGLVVSTMMQKAHELSLLIVVELCLPFLLAGEVTASDRISLGARHLLIVVLGVAYGVCEM